MTVSGLNWLIGGSSNGSLLKSSAASCPVRSVEAWGTGPVVSDKEPQSARFPSPCLSSLHPSNTGTVWRLPSPRHGGPDQPALPRPLSSFPTPCVLHMAFGKIIKQKWNRLRNEHKRINSLELRLHNGNRLPWMNPCTEVMNSRVNALPWVHLYYYITPESIDKVAFFS